MTQITLHQLDGPSSTEQASAIAVASIIDAQAIANDINGRQGALGVDHVYADGTKAALEITSHAGEGVRQRDGIIVADGNQWGAPGEWTWNVRVANPRNIPEIRVKYRIIILALEARGIQNSMGLNPRDVPPLPGELKWAAFSGIKFLCLPQDPTREHVVYVMPEGVGGVVDKRLTGLTDAISAVLAEGCVQHHLAKPRQSDHAEGHLFGGLYEGAIPFAPAGGLIDPNVDLPECEPPSLPEFIDRLWIISNFSHVLIEVRDGEWRFHDLDALNSHLSSGGENEQ